MLSIEIPILTYLSDTWHWYVYENFYIVQIYVKWRHL